MKKESVDEFYVGFVGIRDFLLSKDYLRTKKDPIEKILFLEHLLLQIIILWGLQEDGFLNGDRRYLISSFFGYKEKNT